MHKWLGWGKITIHLFFDIFYTSQIACSNSRYNKNGEIEILKNSVGFPHKYVLRNLIFIENFIRLP